MSIEPASPRKILAGGKLKLKKAKSAPPRVTAMHAHYTQVHFLTQKCKASDDQTAGNDNAGRQNLSQEFVPASHADKVVNDADKGQHRGCQK
jgi:hypothetical protein